MSDYQFERVISGWDALERVQSGSSPDLIVLDSRCVVSEALHTLRWLKRIKPSVPVVLIGPKDDLTLRQEAVRAGAHDYLAPTDAQNCWEVLLRRYLRKNAEFFEQENRSPEMEQVGEDLFFVCFHQRGLIARQWTGFLDLTIP